MYYTQQTCALMAATSYFIDSYMNSNINNISNDGVHFCTRAHRNTESQWMYSLRYYKRLCRVPIDAEFYWPDNIMFHQTMILGLLGLV